MMIDTHCVTVKLVGLFVIPPAVVMTIFPVFAPLGTVAVTVMSLTTVKLAALTPNVTFVVCVRLRPEIVTNVPTGPLVGVKLLIWGSSRNCLLLASVPPGVVTLMGPVVAPFGTFAVRNVSEETVKLAAVPLNETFVVPLKPWPRIPIVVPTLATDCAGRKVTNGPSPTSKL